MREPEKLDINMETFCIRLKPLRRMLALGLGLGIIGITILPPVVAWYWFGYIAALLAIVPCSFLLCKGIHFWGLVCIWAAIVGEWPIFI